MSLRRSLLRSPATHVPNPNQCLQAQKRKRPKPKQRPRHWSEEDLSSPEESNEEERDRIRWKNDKL